MSEGNQCVVPLFHVGRRTRHSVRRWLSTWNSLLGEEHATIHANPHTDTLRSLVSPGTQ